MRKQHEGDGKRIQQAARSTRTVAAVMPLVVAAAVALVAAPASCTFPTIGFAPDTSSSDSSSSSVVTSSTSTGTGGDASSTSSISTAQTTSTMGSTTVTTSTASSTGGASGTGAGGGSGGAVSGGGGSGGTSQGGGGGCCDCDHDGHDSIACHGDDCADHDPRAHGGQPPGFMGYDTPIMGAVSPGTKPYDFNCNGSQQFYYPGTMLDCSSATNCSGSTAWDGPPPACGDSGNYGHCKASGLLPPTCTKIIDGNRPQLCL